MNSGQQVTIPKSSFSSSIVFCDLCVPLELHDVLEAKNGNDHILWFSLERRIALRHNTILSFAERVATKIKPPKLRAGVTNVMPLNQSFMLSDL